MVYDIFQAGSLFPSISGSAICLNGKEELSKLEKEEIKKAIIRIINARGKVNISDLAQELNIPPRKIAGVLNELEKEGIIKEA